MLAWHDDRSLLEKTESVSTQMIVTFISSFDSSCLKKFKFLDKIIARCLSKLSNFGRKVYNFDQVEKSCISQGSTVAFFRFSGQVYKN